MTKWVWDNQLITNIIAFNRFCMANIGELAGWTYPTANEEQLQIVADWCAWLFILDDMCDNTDFGRNYQRISGLHNRFLDILTGANASPEDSAFVHTLVQLRDRTRPLAKEHQWERFVTKIAACFAGCRWEANNRINNLVPDLHAYIENRPYIGGIYAYIELICIASQLDISFTTYLDDPLWNITKLANRTVCWSNDLLSYSREHLHGDYHNIILILQHSKTYINMNPVDYVIHLFNNDVKQFIDIIEHMTPDCELEQYVSILKSLMIGHLEWSRQSSRYNTNERMILQGQNA